MQELEASAADELKGNLEIFAVVWDRSYILYISVCVCVCCLSLLCLDLFIFGLLIHNISFALLKY